MQKIGNVLSLFDGLSGGQIALKRAGIDYDQYYASEVDKYAIEIAKKNNPEMVHLGDVTKWREWSIDWSKIGLLIGGSPCQGFSFAGKRLNFDDPRSKLFFVYVDILKHIRSFNPDVKFMLENVKMKKQSLDVISETLGVQPVFINSASVSAQNRQRYYWTNWAVTVPKDRGVVLADVIENGAVDRDKSFCIDANYFKGGNLKQYFEKHRRQLVFSGDGLCHVGDADLNGHDLIKRVYHPAGKSPTLNTMSGGNREPKILVEPDKWRKLTPLECERLQTVPEGYTEGVSNSQRYKMLGNGWTVDVIAHIFDEGLV